MSGEIVFVSGSPSPTSRSAFVGSVVAERARSAGFATRVFAVRDFEPSDLILGQANGASTKAFLEAVAGSVAVVLSTPVYKAAYTGALKALVDLIPPDALVGRAALGVATTRLGAHVSEVDRAYLALFAFFRARVVPSLVVLDDELRFEAGRGTLAPPAEERVEQAARALVVAARGTGGAVP